MGPIACNENLLQHLYLANGARNGEHPAHFAFIQTHLLHVWSPNGQMRTGMVKEEGWREREKEGRIPEERRGRETDIEGSRISTKWLLSLKSHLWSHSHWKCHTHLWFKEEAGFRQKFSSPKLCAKTSRGCPNSCELFNSPTSKNRRRREQRRRHKAENKGEDTKEEKTREKIRKARCRQKIQDKKQMMMSIQITQIWTIFTRRKEH